ncbi:hypothetical protein ACTCUG_03345 [Latilactobacillus sakei]|uniref:hypothetical protein n=3 Tax=Latilactobacillus sakei TaxID=1599 RepID=UPI000975AB7E|nr:hypothetical protein [Latilactobacillus sakei]MCB4408409.1 hypothetical protein [Latilactobacillus sakei]MCP8855874.1 hypothetical protein [Latilactobacillus sakei]
MDNYRNKLKVFISSKIGSNENDQKYMLARTAAKKVLEMTGLFTVYSFETAGPSTGSAIDDYQEELKASDVCIVLIDNKDGVPEGVKKEIETINKFRIPTLYYFCEERNNQPTQLQEILQNPAGPKFSVIPSFNKFIENCTVNLVDDVLSTYKIKRSLNVQNDVSEDNNLTVQTQLMSSSFYKKEALMNSYCRAFFNNLIFDEKNEIDVDKTDKNFDYYCYKFLSVLFGNDDIESFNMDLFLESLQKILPPNYYEIVKIRWNSNQKYYLEKHDESMELLRKAFEMAKKDGNIEEWFIQDILIDLRNKENEIAELNNEVHRNNYGQNLLNEQKDRVYYPIVDRNEKELLDWIEKDRQKHDLKNNYRESYYGDLSFLGNLIADNYYQMMMFGSLTHISRIYLVIQKLVYQLSVTSDYWPYIVLLLKLTILTSDYNKVEKIVGSFENILEQMDETEARDIYEWSNYLKPSHQQFKANLIAMRTIGLYLNDSDFTLYWNSLRKKIDSWLNDDSSTIFVQPIIFDCLKGICRRLDDNYMVEFCLKILSSTSRRYYRETLILVGRTIDFKSLSSDDSNRIIDTLIKFLDNTKDSDLVEKIKLIFVQLKNQDLEHNTIMEKYIERNWKKYYESEYLFDKNKNEQSENIIIADRVKAIKKRNKTQGVNGNYSMYATNPYFEIENILIHGNPNVDTSLLVDVYKAAVETIIAPDLLAEDKFSAYRLLIFLMRYDKSLIVEMQNELDIIKKIKDFSSLKNMMISSMDSSMLVLCHLLVLECVGVKNSIEIANILSVLNNSNQQIPACQIIQVFFYNYKNVRIRADLENLFFQNSLMWASSKDRGIRWHNMHLMLKLLEKKKFKKIIGQYFRKTMNSDNAIIKSQIIHRLDDIKLVDRKLGTDIQKNAEQDNNFIIRMIAEGKY